MGGSDYVEIFMVLTFLAGSANGTMRCFDITIEDDTALEGEETFTVTLTTQDSVLLEEDEILVTISDNDGIYTNFAPLWLTLQLTMFTFRGECDHT